MQDGSELGHKNYTENGPEKGTWTVGSQDRELWGYASRNMAYCEIPHKEGWTKDTNCNSWSFIQTIKPMYLQIA
jgi:hypothetical protein